MNSIILEKYLWLKDDVIWLDEVDEKYDPEAEFKRKVDLLDEKAAEQIFFIQSLIDKNSLKKDLIAYRLCHIPNIKKDDAFQDLGFVSVTFSVKYLEKLIEAVERKYNSLIKPVIAVLSIEKGTKGIFPYLITNNLKEEAEFLLDVNTVFYVLDDGDKLEISGIEYKVINLDVTFIAMEESYQKYKNSKTTTKQKIHKYEDKLSSKRSN